MIRFSLDITSNAPDSIYKRIKKAGGKPRNWEVYSNVNVVSIEAPDMETANKIVDELYGPETEIINGDAFASRDSNSFYINGHD
jgi:hypothetical protein